jgi:GAF domain-containing protein
MALLRRNRKADVDVASCLANLDRLAALERSGLTTRPSSPKLDALVRAAAERLDTPMAYLNVLDAERLYVVASYGHDGPREQAADQSWCQHVTAADDVFVVSDAMSDPLVRDHSATAGGIRSYLGVPIRSEGQCLGSFCVVDRAPRQWSDDDLHELESLAAEALAAAL